MKKPNWGTYAFEFLSIFVAVILAFALSNWNDNRRDRNTEVSILAEIKNGLQKDIDDVKLNMSGHKDGIRACEYWNNLVQNAETNLDSFTYHYFNLTRDYISIQNNSGYESLKSKGLEIIKNDSLRFDIISFYEYDLNILEKFEEAYREMQFHDSYYHNINNIIAPNLTFDSLGNIGIRLPLNLSQIEKNILLSNLWKIRVNRNFILTYYVEIGSKINNLVAKIEEEIR